MSTSRKQRADLERELLEAAHAGNHKKVLQLLNKHNVNIFCTNKKGWAPIHMASHNGHVHVVRCLLEKVTSPEEKTQLLWSRKNNDWLPIHLGAQNNHLGLVEYLLNEDRNLVDACRQDDWTALHLAAQNGHLHICVCVLAHGANIEAKRRFGWGALHVSAQNGHLPICAFLLQKGADIEAVDRDGWTPLFVAAQNGQVEVLLHLIAHGANINVRDSISGSTPLHAAAQRGHLDAVDALLRNGADPKCSLQSRNGKRVKRNSTPRDIALSKHQYHVAEHIEKFLRKAKEQETSEATISTTNSEMDATDHSITTPSPSVTATEKQAAPAAPETPDRSVSTVSAPAPASIVAVPIPLAIPSHDNSQANGKPFDDEVSYMENSITTEMTPQLEDASTVQTLPESATDDRDLVNASIMVEAKPLEGGVEMVILDSEEENKQIGTEGEVERGLSIPSPPKTYDPYQNEMESLPADQDTSVIGQGDARLESTGEPPFAEQSLQSTSGEIEDAEHDIVFESEPQAEQGTVFESETQASSGNAAMESDEKEVDQETGVVPEHTSEQLGSSTGPRIGDHVEPSRATLVDSTTEENEATLAKDDDAEPMDIVDAASEVPVSTAGPEAETAGENNLSEREGAKCNSRTPDALLELEETSEDGENIEQPASIEDVQDATQANSGQRVETMIEAAETMNEPTHSGVTYVNASETANQAYESQAPVENDVQQESPTPPTHMPSPPEEEHPVASDDTFLNVETTTERSTEVQEDIASAEESAPPPAELSEQQGTRSTDIGIASQVNECTNEADAGDTETWVEVSANEPSDLHEQINVTGVEMDSGPDAGAGTVEVAHDVSPRSLQVDFEGGGLPNTPSLRSAHLSVASPAIIPDHGTRAIEDQDDQGESKLQDESGNGESDNDETDQDVGPTSSDEAPAGSSLQTLDHEPEKTPISFENHEDISASAGPIMPEVMPSTGVAQIGYDNPRGVEQAKEQEGDRFNSIPPSEVHSPEDQELLKPISPREVQEPVGDGLLKPVAPRQVEGVREQGVSGAISPPQATKQKGRGLLDAVSPDKADSAMTDTLESESEIEAPVLTVLEVPSQSPPPIPNSDSTLSEDGEHPSSLPVILERNSDGEVIEFSINKGEMDESSMATVQIKNGGSWDSSAEDELSEGNEFDILSRYVDRLKARTLNDSPASRGSGQDVTTVSSPGAVSKEDYTKLLHDIEELKSLIDSDRVTRQEFMNLVEEQRTIKAHALGKTDSVSREEFDKIVADTSQLKPLLDQTSEAKENHSVLHQELMALKEHAKQHALASERVDELTRQIDSQTVLRANTVSREEFQALRDEVARMKKAQVSSDKQEALAREVDALKTMMTKEHPELSGLKSIAQRLEAVENLLSEERLHSVARQEKLSASLKELQPLLANNDSEQAKLRRVVSELQAALKHTQEKYVTREEHRAALQLVKPAEGTLVSRSEYDSLSQEIAQFLMFSKQHFVLQSDLARLKRDNQELKGTVDQLQVSRHDYDSLDQKVEDLATQGVKGFVTQKLYEDLAHENQEIKELLMEIAHGCAKIKTRVDVLDHKQPAVWKEQLTWLVILFCAMMVANQAGVVNFFAESAVKSLR